MTVAIAVHQPRPPAGGRGTIHAATRAIAAASAAGAALVLFPEPCEGLCDDEATAAAEARA